MPFDPTAHPTLTDLGERLRELAGDAAYKAGRDYLRKSRVQDGTVAVHSAFATVKGSTEYRVTVAFPSVETTKVTCTCPAHRRSKYCKHVVAVCTALIEQPATFAVVDALPEAPTPTRTPRSPRRQAAPKAQPAELRAAGLEVLDRLLLELAGGGLVQLGPDKAALIQQCAELVRALKLRRLGNLLMQLQRAVASPAALDGATFSRLLVDLYLCRAATGAALDGTIDLDPRLAEDLLGKTWRAEELEPISGLELVQVASTREQDSEFVVESSYLADLASGEVYAERQISPVQLRRTAQKTQHRLRLVVEEAGLYPGLAPRRIRLGRVQRAPLRFEDIVRLVEHATDDLTEVQRRLIERASVPLGQAEVAVLFRPTLLMAEAGHEKAASKPARRVATQTQVASFGAVDAAGRFVAASMAGVTTGNLAAVTLEPGSFALFGLAALAESGLTLHCLSVVGAGAGAAGEMMLGGIFSGS